MNAWEPPAVLARLDRVGVCLSLACAGQCPATPLVVAVLLLAGLGLFVEGPLELGFVGASMVLTTGSLCWGFRTHRHVSVFAVLATAVGMILVGHLLADEPYELVLVVVAAVLLAGGPLLNRYLCRTCHRCEEETSHEST